MAASGSSDVVETAAEKTKALEADVRRAARLLAKRQLKASVGEPA
mgnify:CR=1 FL=1